MQWRVARELRDCEGIAWVRRELAVFDWTELDWITARRTMGRLRETRSGIKFEPLSGACKPPVRRLSGYRINTRVSRFCGFPRSVRSGATVSDQSGAFVWLIAYEAAHYLSATGQIPGPNDEAACDAFADTLLMRFRENP